MLRGGREIDHLFGAAQPIGNSITLVGKSQIYKLLFSLNYISFYAAKDMMLNKISTILTG